MAVKSTSDQLAARWIKPAVRELAAYHVPDASGLIKLDAMENPYTWPEELRVAWAEELRDVALNRYPDPRAEALLGPLREAMGIPDDMALMLGNGSDEIIQIIALALAGSGDSAPVLLSVEPSFVMYRMIATFCGLDYVGVPLRAEDFGLDRDALLAAIEQHGPAVVFLAYPNNPTGNLFEREVIEAVLGAAPGLVVLDEAYAPFTDQSFMAELGRYPNLVVMRTLSKMGLAGLRLGMLAGPPAWVAEFDKVRLPYNVNVLTQASARFALRHADLFDEQTAQIRAERAALDAALRSTPGVEVFSSQANFLLFRLAEPDAVFAGLRENGVLIKRLHGSHPLLEGCLRVTVGTPAENAAFVGALRQLVRA